MYLNSVVINVIIFKDSTTADTACVNEPPSGWKSVPLPDATRRNVSRLRATGGDPTCVPPDFNSTMLAVWEELWHAMPQSGGVSVTVKSLLQQYKERCTAERKRPRQAESPAPLLPVSFALAKDWLKQQKSPV